MGVSYSCMKYGFFITTWSEALQICIQHCVSPWPRKSRFKQISVGGGGGGGVELVKDAVCFFGRSS